MAYTEQITNRGHFSIKYSKMQSFKAVFLSHDQEPVRINVRH